MKLKISPILLIIYLIAISLLLKKIQLIPLGLALLLLVFEGKIRGGVKELLYLSIALIPFPVILAIFLFYLPFSGAGIVLSSASFIKRYVFGFALAIFSTLMLYLSLLGFGYKIKPLFMVIILLIPILAILAVLYRKNKIVDAFCVDSSQFRIVIVCLFFLFFAGKVILTSDSLFNSNGTYFYSKFEFIVSGVKDSSQFPFYGPYTAQGEQLYVADAPAFFTHVAFLNLIFSWVPTVLFFNSFSLFLLFLTMMGVALIISEVIRGRETEITPYLVAIGSSAVVLSFVFVQYLESVKQFFVHPLGLLVIAILLSETKRIEEYLIAGVIWVVMVVSHPAQGIGTALMGLSVFLLLQLRKEGILRDFQGFVAQFIQKKWIVIGFIVIIVALPLFYLLPLMEYEEFMRGGPSSSVSTYLPSALTYVQSFFTHEFALSLKNPDLQRLDEKKIGPVFSVLGVLAAGYALLRFKNPHLTKAALILSAFALYLLFSGIAVSLPFVNNTEYGYRTINPYFLLALVVALCAVVHSFGQRVVRLALFGIFIASFLFVLPSIKANLSNIHHESLIGGGSYGEEIAFIKGLPLDGRIITYGHYGNAVDAGLASLTKHYFSRYEFKQFDTSKALYEKIHSSHSWGDPAYISGFADLEFANYLRIGGYKYLFLNICHPSGQVVVPKVYPAFSAPIYQGANQCMVMLSLNDTYYAEKVNVVGADGLADLRKEEGGYRFVSISNRYSFYPSQSEEYYLSSPSERVTLERISPTKAILRGEFHDNEWVVFKEQYFPRWKAEMDGKELTLASTEDYLIAVKTAEGSTITLENKPLLIERIGAILSLLAIIALMILLLMMV